MLIVSSVAVSWLGFQAVHEFGHVLAAWLTGGSVSHVVLHPLRISWTSLDRNPHPQLVAWGGPVFGALLPVGLLSLAWGLRVVGLYVFRFFAGFCLVANGLYLILDSFQRGGDGGTLLLHGASSWQLLVFGALTAPPGFRLWHGIGWRFGLGVPHSSVSRTAAITSVSLLALVVFVELVCFRR